MLRVVYASVCLGCLALCAGFGSVPDLTPKGTGICGLEPQVAALYDHITSACVPTCYNPESWEADASCYTQEPASAASRCLCTDHYLNLQGIDPKIGKRPNIIYVDGPTPYCIPPEECDSQNAVAADCQRLNGRMRLPDGYWCYHRKPNFSPMLPGETAEAHCAEVFTTAGGVPRLCEWRNNGCRAKLTDGLVSCPNWESFCPAPPPPDPDLNPLPTEHWGTCSVG